MHFHSQIYSVVGLREFKMFVCRLISSRPTSEMDAWDWCIQIKTDWRECSSWTELDNLSEPLIMSELMHRIFGPIRACQLRSVPNWDYGLGGLGSRIGPKFATTIHQVTLNTATRYAIALIKAFRVRIQIWTGDKKERFLSLYGKLSLCLVFRVSHFM